MKKLFILFITVFISGCAIAPLTSYTTGRSLGAGGMNLSGGVMPKQNLGGVHWDDPIPFARFDVGLSDNFDLGLQYEIFSWGLNAKYSFINNKENGLSLAGLGGVGVSFSNGDYYYLGPVISYKLNFFEPYVSARYNHINYQGLKTDYLTIEKHSYHYFQANLGSIFWLAKWFGLGAEYTIFSGDAGFSNSGKGLFSASAVFRF